MMTMAQRRYFMKLLAEQARDTANASSASAQSPEIVAALLHFTSINDGSCNSR